MVMIVKKPEKKRCGFVSVTHVTNVITGVSGLSPYTKSCCQSGQDDKRKARPWAAAGG